MLRMCAMCCVNLVLSSFCLSKILFVSSSAEFFSCVFLISFQIGFRTSFHVHSTILLTFFLVGEADLGVRGYKSFQAGTSIGSSLAFKLLLLPAFHLLFCFSLVFPIEHRNTVTAQVPSTPPEQAQEEAPTLPSFALAQVRHEDNSKKK